MTKTCALDTKRRALLDTRTCSYALETVGVVLIALGALAAFAPLAFILGGL